MDRTYRVKPGRYVMYGGFRFYAGQEVKDDRLRHHPDFEEVVEIPGIGSGAVIDLADSTAVLNPASPVSEGPVAQVAQIEHENSAKIDKPKGKKPKA